MCRCSVQPMGARHPDDRLVLPLYVRKLHFQGSAENLLIVLSAAAASCLQACCW